MNNGFNSLFLFLTQVVRMPVQLARLIHRALLVVVFGIIALVFLCIVLSPFFGWGIILGGIIIVELVYILLALGLLTPEAILGVFGISLIGGSGWATHGQETIVRLQDILLKMIVFLGILPLTLLSVAKPEENVPGAIAAYVMGGVIGIFVLYKKSSGTIAANMGLAISISWVIGYVFLPTSWQAPVLLAGAFILFVVLEGYHKTITIKKAFGAVLIALLSIFFLWLIRPDITSSWWGEVASRHGWETGSTRPNGASPKIGEGAARHKTADVETGGRTNKPRGALLDPETASPTVSACSRKKSVFSDSFNPNETTGGVLILVKKATPGRYILTSSGTRTYKLYGDSGQIMRTCEINAKGIIKDDHCGKKDHYFVVEAPDWRSTLPVSDPAYFGSIVVGYDTVKEYAGPEHSFTVEVTGPITVRTNVYDKQVPGLDPSKQYFDGTGSFQVNLEKCL